ncbi:hypothetical protein CY34DRAFT_717222 [Suillus luteus UH-Slu-Lm8-n1]|uniref:Unplaced genomic scaffold CY34scaffold_84, whole genome shotgun sequence n=1 Tax=Suillus luteus UH-Slu-Lm8-n1 TaxID=930992 RepID=A0A0D0B001_9AGAM|nr:hypothetical protein CY34DRAFT_717222 [Suillus luteus UH-Slu-Lm8-n1]
MQKYKLDSQNRKHRAVAQVSHLLIEKLPMLTQVCQVHLKHSSSKRQKAGQPSAPAVSGVAAGLAKVDEAKAATTARTIEEETRIICESCDLGSDDFEEDSRRTAGFYVLKTL